MNGNENKVIILSACPVDAAVWERYSEGNDYIIACDAGYRNAERLNVKPDIVVGDFDSAPRPEREGLVILPHVKDDTDTQYAVTMALERNPKQVVLLGALGGKRFEHTVANISTGLWLEKHGVKAILADERSEIHYLIPGQPLRLEKEDWFYLSLFPIGDKLEGVSVEGCFYSLKDATLTVDYPLGVSNEFTAESAVLSCESGYGLVILTKADE